MTNRPNVLWITTDQQRADTIRALGNSHIATPNLDRLCAEGVAFTRAYCQNPICTPSRSSFMTGLYASALPGNINGNRRLNLPDGVELITRRFADAGYRCGLSGKLHLSSPWNGVEERVDDGYTEFHFSHSPCQLFDRSNDYVAWVDDMGMTDRVFDVSNHDPELRRGVSYRPDVPFELHQTTWCCDRAIDFMREHRGRPWLFSVNIFDPHPPMDAPKQYQDRYDPDELPDPVFSESDIAHNERLGTHVFQGSPTAPTAAAKRQKSAYYGMIELIDENIGRLLGALEETGQRENTVVIFDSDHGEMLGDHGLSAKGCRFYEGLVKVPLIVSWPRQFGMGVRNDSLVELTDLAPTLAELAGIDTGPTHGRSLVPLLSPEANGGAASGDVPGHAAGAAPSDGRSADAHPSGARHREFVRCEFYDTLAMGFGTGREEAPASYATMFRTERWKLNVYHGNEYGELYDMVEDPNELANLWEDRDYQDIKHSLIRRSFDVTAVGQAAQVPRMGRF